MGSTMMEEEQEPLSEEPGGGMQIAIARTFSVAPVDDFVIKLEPQELPDMIAAEVMMEEHQHDLFEDDPMEDDEDNLAPVLPEDSDFVMQRAVSPPFYVDPSEDRIEELILIYKKKYDLKDLRIKLEPCDKIWETLQLIKNILCSYQSDLPKNCSKSQQKTSDTLIPHQTLLGSESKLIPDFRFSVKSKKKLYHCITCGKEFIDSQRLHQHAIDEHGVYVAPKRIYKMRADSLPKDQPVTSDINKMKYNESMDTEYVLTSQIQIPSNVSNESIQPTQLLQPESINIDYSKINETNTEEPQVKVNTMKEKIKCVLCKRVCTDIVYHIKGYHKVNCFKTIIPQCEKVIENSNVATHSRMQIKDIRENNLELNDIDLNEPLAVSVKKRKRNAPRWTIQKKKFKTVKTIESSVVKSSKKGPFKCMICLGVYKNIKSFAYHRKMHRIRGQTAENFDPTKCRFINSPLRIRKGCQPLENEFYTHMPLQNETEKSQTTEYITKEREVLQSNIEDKELKNSEDGSTDNENLIEQTTCECGRSFRNYHTMYLHKVKCQRIVKNDKTHFQSNDIDSGVGISIKIKKNKNDSYEVVPRDIPIEESYKDSRNSKDSDASSNDSGLASIDYNNQKVDIVDVSKYSKGRILVIQVAEDDEEVDIEDGDSNHSNLDTANFVKPQTNDSEAIQLIENKSQTQNINRTVETASKNNLVPSLVNLCKKMLSQSKQLDNKVTSYKCQTCSLYFKNKTDLMEHGLSMKHSIKSHCPCGKKFKNLKFFNIHVRRFHPQLLKCSYCKTNFDRIEKYMEHNCDVVEGDLFIEPIIQTECTQCKSLVDIGEPFDKHMKTHKLDQATYKCFKCELYFENIHVRRSHFSKEHGFSLCPICGKLLHIDCLSKHEAYHDGLGFPCHLCKKAFTQKVLLKKHVQCTHDPLVNDVVKCSVCSKTIKLRYLKKHVSLHLHTEICIKCNKCYRSDEQKNLENHVALDHSNDYPVLKCDTCSEIFLSEKRYQEHCNGTSCKFNPTNLLISKQIATTLSQASF